MVIIFDGGGGGGGGVAEACYSTCPSRAYAVRIKVFYLEGGSTSLLFGSSPRTRSFLHVVTEVMSQFSPFEVGQIKAHVYHGLSGAAISRILYKADSKSGAGTEQREGGKVGLGVPRRPRLLSDQHGYI